MSENNGVLSVTDWFIISLIVCVPCINIIMLIVWATSKDINSSKKNFAYASLILAVIGIVLYGGRAVLFSAYIGG